MIKILNEEQLKNMRVACQVVKDLFVYIKPFIKPGVTTKKLDELCKDFIVSKECIPNFTGVNGFPFTICTSINEEVVHGYPTNRKLKEGDILSIDLGAKYKGSHADAARTFPVGKISEEDQKLIDVCEQSFFEGIKNIKSGCNLNQIGKQIQQYVESFGYGVVRDLCGHGIGTSLHADPEVLNYDGYIGTGGKIFENETLAIEPMITAGSYEVDFNENSLLVVTSDGKKAAHYENTVLITKNGVEVLTLDNGGNDVKGRFN